MVAYVQCRMEQERPTGRVEKIAWIPERGAKVGARVELKGEEGLWHVLGAPGPAIEGSDLSEKQARDRRSLQSIAGT